MQSSSDWPVSSYRGPVVALAGCTSIALRPSLYNTPLQRRNKVVDMVYCSVRFATSENGSLRDFIRRSNLEKQRTSFLWPANSCRCTIHGSLPVSQFSGETVDEPLFCAALVKQAAHRLAGGSRASERAHSAVSLHNKTGHCSSVL